MKNFISTIREKVSRANCSWWNFWAWYFISKYTRTKNPIWVKAYHICHEKEEKHFQEAYANYYN